MAKRMLIDATHTEETRAVVVSGNRLEEFDFESTTKTQLKGNIYLAKVTRVEPSLQAAFVDYGGNRHGFLAFSEIHPDYYRIPVADREALLAEVSSQQQDIDIDDHGVEEIEDDDAGMDTTSPHDVDIDADVDDEAAEADQEAADQAGDDSEPPINAENVQAEEGLTEEEQTEPDDGQESTDADAGDIQAGDETPDDESAGDGDEKDKGKPNRYATLDQDDIAVTGKKPEDADDANDDASDADDNIAEAADTDSDGDGDGQLDEPSSEGPDADGGAELNATEEVGSTSPLTEPEGESDAPAVADAASVSSEASDTDVEASAVEVVAENTPSESSDAPVEGRGGDRARGPANRRGRGRGRGRRERDVESVGGEDVDDFERSKAWHRRYRIQEVISRRQILLVQVAKEERGNKGAALTTYISLAGRYCVLMPNTPRGGGISRKIANAQDRRKLKEIVGGLNIPSGMAVIVRTAGSQRTKAEIRRDYKYLIKLWDEIRERTLQSTAPSLIHEEANLIKRSIRDLYSKDIDEVLVEGDEGYKTAKGFMRLLMPSHAKRVKAYKEEAMPLFHRYQVEAQIDNIYSPTVQLKSGGYIVLNATEALVAIDVNSGRATRERNIEETAYRTNLEAADEIARQLRLRDLAGLIVIDFIDMEEGRNRYNVERRLKEAMKHDRARIQLGRISAFGLLEMSRQRLRPSIAEISAQPCPTCGGSGVVRSIESSALQILRAIEEEGMRQRTETLTVSMPSEVAFYIMNNKRPALMEIENRYELTVFIRGDDNLVPPDHTIEVGDGEEEAEAAPARTRKRSNEGDDADRGKKRRGRRRRSRSDDDDAKLEEAQDQDAAEVEEGDSDADDDAKGERRGSRRRGRRGGRKRAKRSDTEANAADEGSTEKAEVSAAQSDDSDGEDATVSQETVAATDDEAPAPRRRRRRRTSSRVQPKDDSPSFSGVSDSKPQGQDKSENQAEQQPAQATDADPADPVTEKAADAPQPESADTEAAVDTPPSAVTDASAEPAPADTPDAADSPPAPEAAPGKRRGGWWSFSRNAPDAG